MLFTLLILLFFKQKSWFEGFNLPLLENKLAFMVLNSLTKDGIKYSFSERPGFSQFSKCNLVYNPINNISLVDSQGQVKKFAAIHFFDQTFFSKCKRSQLGFLLQVQLLLLLEWFAMISLRKMLDTFFQM